MLREDELGTERVRRVDLRTVLLACSVGAALALAFWPLLRAAPTAASSEALAALPASAELGDAAHELDAQAWADDHAQLSQATSLGMPVAVFDPERLKPIMNALGEKLSPISSDQRLKDRSVLNQRTAT